MRSKTLDSNVLLPPITFDSSNSELRVKILATGAPPATPYHGRWPHLYAASVAVSHVASLEMGSRGVKMARAVAFVLLLVLVSSALAAEARALVLQSLPKGSESPSQASGCTYVSGNAGGDCTVGR
ncbi:hypothetical protein BHE74_00006059 [Ensete ventricosum]|nr:hypothetical protein BHE74_00006059 [Ensete ventricosum]RZS13418.1 hypothetical protein BHM03_00045002 [Ensete ventricosum]